MKQNIRRHGLLVVAILTYVVLFIFKPQDASVAFSHSIYYLLEMARVMPIVFVLTVLIDAWVPQKTIQHALGSNSRGHGVFYAFLLGSLSAGPIYAAFPLGKMLFKKGASVRNVVIILSAWAVIKVPMLANEVRFLGFRFMAFRWILTVVAIYLMGTIMQKFVTIDQVNLKAESRQVDVDSENCIGCGQCVTSYPQMFKMDKDKAIRVGEVSDAEDVLAILAVCPVQAIVTNNKKSA